MPGENRAREPLSGMDMVMLEMETPTNLMVINGVMILAAPLAIEDLRAVIQDRLLSIRRFRQRVVPAAGPFSTPTWEDDPSFDIDNHVHRAVLLRQHRLQYAEHRSFGRPRHTVHAGVLPGNLLRPVAGFVHVRLLPARDGNTRLHESPTAHRRSCHMVATFQESRLLRGPRQQDLPYGRARRDRER